MTLGLISDRGRETIMHFAVSITYSVVALGLLSTVRWRCAGLFSMHFVASTACPAFSGGVARPPRHICRPPMPALPLPSRPHAQVGALSTFGSNRVVFYREAASGDWTGGQVGRWAGG